MKIQKITAYIQPFALDSMVDALFASGACGITVSEVSGKGRSKSSHLVPRICLELCVQETAVKKILDTIKKSSHSTQHGAGKVTVTTLENVVRIRTGETGHNAI